MRRRDRRRDRGQRGSSLLEVLVAGAVLLVAFAGFVATANTAASATAVAHRRGTASYLRTGLLERYAVTSRTAYAAVPANTWVVDRCFDSASRQDGGPNTAFSTSFACPATSAYRTWVRLAGTGPWTLSVYAERIQPGCTAATRFSSLSCVAADLFLTD
jgi:Tfp pilus assembly protein PilV